MYQFLNEIMDDDEERFSRVLSGTESVLKIESEDSEAESETEAEKESETESETTKIVLGPRPYRPLMSEERNNKVIERISHEDVFGPGPSRPFTKEGIIYKTAERLDEISAI